MIFEDHLVMQLHSGCSDVMISSKLCILKGINQIESPDATPQQTVAVARH